MWKRIKQWFTRNKKPRVRHWLDVPDPEEDIAETRMLTPEEADELEKLLQEEDK